MTLTHSATPLTEDKISRDEERERERREREREREREGEREDREERERERERGEREREREKVDRGVHVVIYLSKARPTDRPTGHRGGQSVPAMRTAAAAAITHSFCNEPFIIIMPKTPLIAP